MSEVPPDSPTTPPTTRSPDAGADPEAVDGPAVEAPIGPSSVSQRLSAMPFVEPLAAEPREVREKLARALVGTKIKGWRLARLLGVGPVSAAFEAFKGEGDAGEHATVKVLLGAAAKSERARTLFVRSAYAASRFRHPRVLAVLEDGLSADGVPFVARPWDDAKPLADTVATNKLDEESVLRIAEQLLDALEIAHAHGIVHGAITPTNILLTTRSSIRLCDFASPPGTAAQADASDPLAELRRGPYTAPERTADLPSPADEPGDVYSVAACMYFALHGKPPAPGGAHGPERETASEALKLLIAHALQTDPAERYDSAYAMLGDVRRVMAGRKPKLGAALRPVPSGGYVEGPQPPASTLRFQAKPARAMPSATARALREKEWRGNIALVFAFAALVGIATFVLIREKREDAREREKNAPAAPAPAL